MRFKVFVFLSCACIFCLHFSMTILHNVPEKYLSPRMESYSHLWCYPVFHQGWALFAPEPQDMTKHMDVRYASEGMWSEWSRVEDICMEEHLRFRVTHFSKLCHVTQNATYHLWLTLNKYELQQRPAKDFFPAETGYGIAIHYAKSYAYHYLGNPTMDSLEVRLVLEDPFEIEPPTNYSFPVYANSEE